MKKKVKEELTVESFVDSLDEMQKAGKGKGALFAFCLKHAGFVQRNEKAIQLEMENRFGKKENNTPLSVDSNKK